MKNLKTLPKKLPYNQVIIDTLNLAARSHFGIRTEYEGTPTGMLVGVFRLCLTMARVYPTSRVVWLWEGFQSKRKALSPVYKSNRRDKDDSFRGNLEVVRAMVESMGFDQMCHVGLEADDLAGWIVRQSERGDRLLLVSNDEDWFQYMRPGVDIQRRDTVETYAEVANTLGYPPERIGLWKVLKGDDSDGLSGVPRFPSALAHKMMQTCATVKDLLEFDFDGAGFPGWGERLRESAEVINRNSMMVLFNPEWVRPSDIVTTPGVKDFSKVEKILTGYGMNDAINRLRGFVNG